MGESGHVRVALFYVVGQGIAGRVVRSSVFISRRSFFNVGANQVQDHIMSIKPVYDLRAAAHRNMPRQSAWYFTWLAATAQTANS